MVIRDWTMIYLQNGQIVNGVVDVQATYQWNSLTSWPEVFNTGKVSVGSFMLTMRFWSMGWWIKPTGPSPALGIPPGFPVPSAFGLMITRIGDSGFRPRTSA